MIFSSNTTIRSTSCLASLQTIANLDEVTVWIPEVNGQEPPGGTLPLVWAGEDLDSQVAKSIRDFVYWVLSQEAEVPAPWYSLAGKVGSQHGILEADLVGTEVQRPFARTFLPGLHTESLLVKRDGAVNVSYTEYYVIKTDNLHVYSQ